LKIPIKGLSSSGVDHNLQWLCHEKSSTNGADSFGFQPRGRKVHQVHETSLKVRASSSAADQAKSASYFYQTPVNP